LVNRVASCIWLISPELILALDRRLGDPLDSYVNGSQVWLRDDTAVGSSSVGIEWRLHPVAGYRRPAGVITEEVFAATVYALHAAQVPEMATDSLVVDPPADATWGPATLWAGLEAFPCDGDEVEPAPLAASCTAVLGIAPDAFGVVDHTSVADEWERSLGREASIIDLLLQQLQGDGAER
jgi:hypothetical protein